MHQFLNTPLAIDPVYARALRAQLDKTPDYLSQAVVQARPSVVFLQIPLEADATACQFESSGRRSAQEPDAAADVQATASGSNSAARTSVNIASIPIRGVMTRYDQACSYGTESLTAWVKQADANPSIDGILLEMDTPGGQVGGLDGLYAAVAATTKPIVAYVKGTAASAGYWAIMAADSIVLESALISTVGSIGVLVASEYETTPKTKIEIVLADGSEDKVTQEPNSPLTDDTRAEIKKFINPIQKDFVAKVKAHRPAVSPKALTGKVFTGKQAIKMGLADKIGGLEVAIKEIMKRIQ